MAAAPDGIGLENRFRYPRRSSFAYAAFPREGRPPGDRIPHFGYDLFGFLLPESSA
jgi:hypothetical protein